MNSPWSHKGVFAVSGNLQVEEKPKKLRRQNTGESAFERVIIGAITWFGSSWVNCIVVTLFSTAILLLGLRIYEVADRLDTTFGGALKWVCMGNY